MKKITKKLFDRYEEVRREGIVSMWDIMGVSRRAGLTEEEVIKITEGYSNYAQQYKTN